MGSITRKDLEKAQQDAPKESAIKYSIKLLERFKSALEKGEDTARIMIDSGTVEYQKRTAFLIDAVLEEQEGLYIEYETYKDEFGNPYTLIDAYLERPEKSNKICQCLFIRLAILILISFVIILICV